MKIKPNILKFEFKKAYLLIGFFCCFFIKTFSQDQKYSDSLKIVLKENTYERHKKLKILEDIASYETDTNEIILYSKELIESAKEMDSLHYLYSGYLQIGNAYRLNGDLTTALENYFTASKAAIDQNLISEQGSIKIAIGDAYSIMEDSKNAVRYYRKSISLLKERVSSIEVKYLDSLNLASAQLNLGDEYFNQQKLDSALYFFGESGLLFKAVKSEIGEAYNLGNVGLVYAQKGENLKAEENLNKAIVVLTEIEDFYPICVYLNAMSDIYYDKKQTQKALLHAKRSLELAAKYGLKEQISDGYLKLSSIYERRGQYKNSFELYKNHIKYRDSVNNINAVQDMADQDSKYKISLANEKAKFEVEKKQGEVDLLNQQKKTQKIIVIAITIALILIGVFAFSLFKTNKIIDKEKKRSDNLLQNILPEETALELKEKGSVEAKKFESVSVLFTDFKGFTASSEKLSPEELVKSIDFYFSKFDSIMEKYQIEKIKTIGDAYMCVAGLPFPSKNHAYKVCLAALEIVEFVQQTMNNDNHALAKFHIRVGIHSGPVVSGVVGTKKFAYDVWGDTVNLASRMESSSEIGCVNISEKTYNLLKNYTEFSFESRGEIEAKGKGKVKMYFVSK
ncbi:adenylate/guanylate cyclase domain-containing protein [Polaribacter sp.]|uniref:adenylate/guanylate cyclase domain-containing protein n=1 Tax=Polaribacter sp. TaxID=1920175 RepID=UPI003EF7800B